MVLHGDKRRQAVRQGVICGIARSALRSRDRPAGLAERWTNFAWRELAREGGKRAVRWKRTAWYVHWYAQQELMAR